MTSPIPTVTLNDGTSLPAIGLGTYKLKGASGVAAATSALDLGYRLLDSAYNYENEGTIGQAVRASGVPREEILVTSKLPGRHYHYDHAIETVYESLYRTGLEYLDLYLLHWPNPKNGLFVEAWRALVEMQRRGVLKSIGVCNFLPEHLERVIEDSGVTPVLNQIELHPYWPQAEQRLANEQLGVATESWSPLGRSTGLLDEPVIVELARILGRTPAQVVLRWHVQLGAIPLPKSLHPERQRENLDVFDFALSDEQMNEVSSLSRPHGRLWDQDPAQYEEY